MPQQLKYVAQLAEDLYYQQYKGDDDFFDLDDFVRNCGNTIAAMYMQFYLQEYAMQRQDRKNDAEVISFDAGWLLEQEVEVVKNGVGIYAKLDNAVMTFPYDKSSIGLQNIFITEPFSTDEVERTSLTSLWQLKYIPKTNRIFFYSEVSANDCLTISKIGFVNKGNCNIKKIRVLYVPSMVDENALVADGIINDAVMKTVATMKQLASGNVVDMTADGNSNKIPQTEINKQTLTK